MMPLNTYCSLGKLICRERKIQVYAKPLHASSLNTFFSTILAWQRQGTIHGETGDDGTAWMFSFQLAECSPAGILAPRTEAAGRCPQIALGGARYCSGCACRLRWS